MSSMIDLTDLAGKSKRKKKKRKINEKRKKVSPPDRTKLTPTSLSTAWWWWKLGVWGERRRWKRKSSQVKKGRNCKSLQAQFKLKQLNFSFIVLVNIFWCFIAVALQRQQSLPNGRIYKYPYKHTVRLHSITCSFCCFCFSHFHFHFVLALELPPHL